MNKIYENPDIVVWEITLKCNLNCMHCGSSAGNPRPDELSTKEAIKLCRDLADIGFKGIALMGGELFLRRDWYEISKEIKDLGIKLSIISNGFVDAKKIVPMLTKLGADCVMVGLDGASPKTQDKIRGMKGAFEKAIEFLRECKRNGLTTGVITTVHKLNLKELPKIRDLIVKEEFDWQIQEATPIGRFPRNLALSEEEYYSLALFIFSTQKKI